MSTYTITLIPLSAMNFLGAAPSDFQIQYGSGSGFDWGTYHFDYTAADTLAVTVNDADDVLQDDPGNPWWSGGSFPPHAQVIGDAVTVDGSIYAAGLRIEDEYELNVRDLDGNIYRMVAISVDSDPSNPYSGSTVIGYTFDGAWPPAEAKLTIIRGSGQDGQQMAAPVCFGAGTGIATPRGDIAVDRLRRGDLVLTHDQGPQPLLMIATRWLGPQALAATPALRPIRIAAGAIGPDTPRRDLLVSPQHRVLVASRIAARMFGCPEVLVAAKHLLGAPGIAVACDRTEVTYFHLLLDRHQILSANGAPCESLYAGPQALRGLSPAARQQVMALLPDLAGPAQIAPLPARPLVAAKRARRLAMRHLKNRQAFLDLATPAVTPAVAARA
ncbi:MAG: Hint domain-containing protein [Pseudodonghicola sp.]